MIFYHFVTLSQLLLYLCAHNNILLLNTMRKRLLIGMMVCGALSAHAQGSNTGTGGDDPGVASLAERVLGLEKKNDKFNVFFNYTASARAGDESGDWQSAISAKELRFEITGHLTDRIFYRFRHRLNKTNAAQRADNFAKATDMMFVSYKLNDQVELTGGKVCQAWGGFEYDENPMYVYQYSDFGEYMEIFFGGAHVSYKPVPTQEFVAQVTHTDNGTMEDYYGNRPVAIGNNGPGAELLEQSNAPFTYILNWNGDFLDGKLQTRWGAGIQQQAKGKTSKVVMLGQQLTLPRVQWYVDYMERWDDVDRYGFISKELMPHGPAMDDNFGPNESEYSGDEFGYYFTDTHMRSLVTKARFELAPKWKLMLKGMYDLADVRKIEAYHNYRTALGYFASMEYYPVRSQDFRVYLAYLGRHYGYKKSAGLDNRSTNRIELGFMYRIKCF